MVGSFLAGALRVVVFAAGFLAVVVFLVAEVAAAAGFFAAAVLVAAGFFAAVVLAAGFFAAVVLAGALAAVLRVVVRLAGVSSAAVLAVVRRERVVLPVPSAFWVTVVLSRRNLRVRRPVLVKGDDPSILARPHAPFKRFLRVFPELCLILLIPGGGIVPFQRIGGTICTVSAL